MSRGGSPQAQQRQTTTTTSAPWTEQQPHLKNVFNTAEGLSENPLSFFPGQTFAGFSDETEAALGLQTARALGGNVAQNNANTELAKTLGGDYLDAGNPHFASMAGRIRGEVLPAVDRKWGAARRLGSGLHARAAGLALGDSIGSLAHNDYTNERTNMMRAAAFAPSLAAADYKDIGMLGEVGGVREDLIQQGINEAMARHDFSQMEPWQRLALYQGAIQGNSGRS